MMALNGQRACMHACMCAGGEVRELIMALNGQRACMHACMCAGGEVRELIMALNGQRGGILAVDAISGAVVNEAGEAVEVDDETGGSEDIGGLVAKLRAETKAHSRR